MSRFLSGANLGIQARMRLIMRVEADRIVAMTMESYARSLRGKYKGKGLMEALKEDRAAEAER
jgi:hypothetical protein